MDGKKKFEAAAAIFGFFVLYALVMDRVPETWPGFRKCRGEMGLWQVKTRLFLIFFAIFFGIGRVGI